MSKNSNVTVNYRLRPAKSIERKMLVELFSRMAQFHELSDYQYVGFGGKYFCDFSLVHRSLGLSKMISIEKDSRSKERYQYNRPFKCVDIKFGDSSCVLPSLNYSDPTLMWLDYDGPLNCAVLTDIATVVESISTGSAFWVSFNSSPYRRNNLQNCYPDLRKGLFLEKYKDVFCDNVSLVPIDVDDRGAENWDRHSEVLRQIVVNQIVKIIGDRNSGLNENDKIVMQQVSNFRYADGAEMTTLGFVFHTEEQRDLFEKARFEKLSHYRSEDESFNISVPNLTIKESKELLEYFPLTKKEEIMSLLETKKGVFSENDIDVLASIYRYFPSYFELEGV